MISIEPDLLRLYHMLKRVITDLGYDYEKEYDASLTACVLANSIDIIDPYKIFERLFKKLSNRHILVIGAGPSIYNIDRRLTSEIYDGVICSDGACRVLRENACLDKTCIWVGDLDGGIDSFENISNFQNSFSFLHFHGDNYMDIIKISDKIRGFRDKIVFTVQTLPLCPKTILIPGFTDGDRALLLSKLLKPSKISVVGMDLESYYVSMYSKPFLKDIDLITPSKRRKLEWAKRLIDMFPYY
ncbi:MAG: DUF115 domain-containing protein [Desulfurococcaceae archaeon]|nr:DUF115 domain-containing protein [Desulfurococcaceae archaeon]